MARFAVGKIKELNYISDNNKKEISKNFKTCSHKKTITKLVSQIAKEECAYFLTNHIIMNILKSGQISDREITPEDFSFVALIEDVYLYVNYHVKNDAVEFIDFTKIYDLDSLDEQLEEIVDNDKNTFEGYDVKIRSLWDYVFLNNEGIERMHRCRKQFSSFELFFEIEYRNVKASVATENHELYVVFFREGHNYWSEEAIELKSKISCRIDSIDQLIIRAKEIIKKYINVKRSVNN